MWIALGLAQATPILLLDEPTSHLDVRVAHEILDLLRGLARDGKTVVCALHDLNEAAAYADRIALLGEGTLLDVAPPERSACRRGARTRLRHRDGARTHLGTVACACSSARSSSDESSGRPTPAPSG